MTRDRNKPPGDYLVGYKRPPPASRFKKGQSGNPKGRPMGAPTTSELFLREASRLITIKSGDKLRQIPKREALVRRLIDMAEVQKRLGANDAVAILGFGFDSVWAERNRAAIDRFLGASQQAKEILATMSELAELSKLNIAQRVPKRAPTRLAQASEDDEPTSAAENLDRNR